MPAYPPTSDPFSSTSPVTSSIVGPVPVPSYGPGGHFSVISKTRVPASPAEVLSLVRDTTTWPSWNTFCPTCTISPQTSPSPPSTDPNLVSGKAHWLDLGTVAVVDVFMNGDGLVPGTKRSRTQGLCITRLEKIEEEGKKGYRIAWKGTGWSHWQLHSERVMEFIECELDGAGMGTDYVCWETFGGVLGVMVKTAVGSQLVDRFGDYSRDIRNYFLLQAERDGGK